jgi:hypothetical protein
MSWASIASNQTISFTNLKDACATGVFTEIVTITPSLEQVTAADVGTYTDAIIAGGVASNQLPVKSELSTPARQLVDVSCNGTTSALACALPLLCGAYVNNGVINFGTVLYANSTGSTLYDMTAYTGLFVRIAQYDGIGIVKARFDLATSKVNNSPQSC